MTAAGSGSLTGAMVFCHQLFLLAFHSNVWHTNRGKMPCLDVS
jgi:hypothetical protein